jgi:hypothetical protein
MESYTFDDILAIAKLIPTINREALTNDDLTYWHNQLNKKKRTLTEFINAFTPTNYIDISTFLSVNNPDMYINDTEYTINAIISPDDPLNLTDPSNSEYSLRYKNIILSNNNDLLQVVGKFEEDDNGYFISIIESTILMADWKNFDFDSSIQSST